MPNLREENIEPYDYVILCTKNIPDIAPTAVELIAPALPHNDDNHDNNNHSRTTLLLLQNGLNIEKPFLQRFPSTPILSGISMIGSAEPSPGRIVQDESDRLLIGAFPASSLVSAAEAERRAQELVALYSAAGKTNCVYSAAVLQDRWKKLVFNACLNPICAITGLDDGRIRLAEGALDGLVRPAMREIVAAAEAVCGVVLPEDVVEATIQVDPLESYLKPSMQQDLEKVIFQGKKWVSFFLVLFLLLRLCYSSPSCPNPHDNDACASQVLAMVG